MIMSKIPQCWPHQVLVVLPECDHMLDPMRALSKVDLANVVHGGGRWGNIPRDVPVRFTSWLQ